MAKLLPLKYRRVGLRLGLAFILSLSFLIALGLVFLRPSQAAPAGRLFLIPGKPDTNPIGTIDSDKTMDPTTVATEISKIYLPFVAKSLNNALYVWRDPMRNGTPITLAEAERLANFAVAENIRTIFYDNFGCEGKPGCPTGAEQQSATDLAPIIALLHTQGLRVEALFTDDVHILDVVSYNSSVLPNERFDGIRLDIETFPITNTQPLTPTDLDVYVNAVSTAGTLPVYVSIGHTWNEPITFLGVEKEAYKHILDIVAGIDVQTAQDGRHDDPIVIEKLTKEEICYANEISKTVHITIETYDVVTHEGLKDFNTFFEEGEDKMKSKLASLDYTAPGVDAPCDNPAPTGFAYHFYRQSYGSSEIPKWITNVD